MLYMLWLLRAPSPNFVMGSMMEPLKEMCRRVKASSNFQDLTRRTAHAHAGVRRLI